MFYEGDIICGLENDYGVTNEHMTKAEVLELYSGGSMLIRVLEHNEGNRIGVTFEVENSESKFALVNTAGLSRTPASSDDFRTLFEI